MPNEKLAQIALKILRNPNIWKIAFKLNELEVSGVKFLAVADAIARGDISCLTVDKFVQQPGQMLPQGSLIEAQYKADKNTMLFGNENYGEASIFEQTVILHEATHAIFDLYAKTKNDRVLGVLDETAATLAQALYIRLCGAEKAAHMFGMIIESAGYYALQLADEIIREKGDFQDNGQLYILKSSQIEDLRDAVAKEWGFIKKLDPNGKDYTDNTKALYIYNGVGKCLSCQVKSK